MGFQYRLGVGYVDRRRGLSILWKKGTELEITGYYSSYIDAKVKDWLRENN